MPLDSRSRRELLAASHALTPVARVDPEKITDAVVDHVRSCLRGRKLIKVRIDGDDAGACDAAAAELAARTPCELVKRIGRVAILAEIGEAVGAGAAPGDVA